MAFLTDSDSGSRKKAGTTPAKDPLKLDLKPIGHDLADRLAYKKKVYGGDAGTYWRNRSAIDAQYDYNTKRDRRGQPRLEIANFAWNPEDHDDDTNEALTLWNKDKGTLPDPSRQGEFNYMLREYSRQKAARNRNYGYAPADDDRARAVTQDWKDAMAQRAADEAAAQAPAGGGARGADPTAAARTPAGGGGGGGAWGPEPFNPLNLIGIMGGNPYRGVAKIVPEGIRGPLNSAADVYEWPYWPSNIVRDHVLPIPGMLVKNGIKALDDAVEGKPLEFDPNVSAYELMWRSAQAARRKGDTGTADALELLLSNPTGGRILGSLGEVAADPLTYVDYAGILKALKAAKAAKAGDVPLTHGTQAGAAGPPASPLDDGAGLADDVAGGRGAGYTKGDDVGLPGADGQAVGEALEDDAGAGRGGTEGAGDTGQYTQRIRWGIQDIDVRPAGKGFFGKRIQQNNPKVNAYEQK